VTRLALVCGRPESGIVGSLARIEGDPNRRKATVGRFWLATAGSGVASGPLPLTTKGTQLPAVMGGVRTGGWGGAADRQARWVAVDGFFTNRRALTAELGLAPDSAPEPIVAAAYQRWGEDCLGRLDGQWALLVCDADRGSVLAARDHLGIGQLYYSAEPDVVIIGSEPRTVAAARTTGPEIEPVRFGQFLNGFPPSTPDLTFFRGVRSVPAGGALRVRLDADHRPTATAIQYWNPASPERWQRDVAPFPEAVDRFEDLLVDAVRKRGTIETTGALVSGGMDSSTLAAIAATLAGTRRIPSFSILHDQPELTEEPHIRAVVAHAGLDGHFRTIRPVDAWDAVDEVVHTQGEPLLGQDLIGQWLVYRHGAEHGMRALYDGVGADELLAGVGTEGRYLLDLMRRAKLTELTREIRWFAARIGVHPARVARRYLLGTIRRDAAWALGRRRYRWIARPIPPDPMRERLRSDAAPDRALLNRYLYRHLRHQNAPTVLARLDRTAASLGIQALVPFLDRRLVEWCLPLPDHYKVFHAQPKRLLHAVACRRLPPAVANRTDNMAIVSSSSWMPLRSDYASVIQAVPRERRLRESGWIEARAAERFVDSYLKGGHTDHLAVWRLFTAWRWLELFQLS
jgi:asparagine synthase (glutamine-hydrolysing)